MLQQLSVPYSEPQADGPTIQRAHQVGVKQGITMHDVLATVKEARGRGLRVPLVLMGYYNNIFQYGEHKISGDMAEGTERSGCCCINTPSYTLPAGVS